GLAPEPPAAGPPPAAEPAADAEPAGVSGAAAEAAEPVAEDEGAAEAADPAGAESLEDLELLARGDDEPEDPPPAAVAPVSRPGGLEVGPSRRGLRGAGVDRRPGPGGAGLVLLWIRRLRLSVRAGSALGGAAGGERDAPTGAEVATVAPRPRHLMTRLRWSTL